MKTRPTAFALFLVLIAFYPLFSFAGNRTLENGYTLPKATKENVDKIVHMALDN